MNFLLRSTLALLGSTALLPAAIVISDPSFETGAVAANDATANAATAWNIGGTTFLVDNTSGSQWFNSNVAGVQSLSLGISFMGQQLVDDVNGNVMTTGSSQSYDISFFAGRRLGANATGAGTFSVILQTFNVVGGGYLSDLATKMFQLGTDSDPLTTDLGLGVGAWSSQINLNLTGTAAAGRLLKVVFAQNGAPYGTGSGNLEASIDSVSVTAVPEPSAALLGGLGVLALLRRRR